MSKFHFGKCVQNICKNCYEINAFCMRFETLCRDKFEKTCKNVVFVSNFHIGKCVQIAGKKRLEINTYYKCFETLCGHNF